MTTNRETLLELAARLDGLPVVEVGDNALDVLVEVALFEPDREFQSARSNSAGTKIIYTKHTGAEQTFWAQEWTKGFARTVTVMLLHALAKDETQ